MLTARRVRCSKEKALPAITLLLAPENAVKAPGLEPTEHRALRLEGPHRRGSQLAITHPRSTRVTAPMKGALDRACPADPRKTGDSVGIRRRPSLDQSARANVTASRCSMTPVYAKPARTPLVRHRPPPSPRKLRFRLQLDGGGRWWIPSENLGRRAASYCAKPQAALLGILSSRPSVAPPRCRNHGQPVTASLIKHARAKGTTAGIAFAGCSGRGTTAPSAGPVAVRCSSLEPDPVAEVNLA